MKNAKRELLVVGNWKMNPSTIRAARKLFLDIYERIGTRVPSVRVMIAPPFPFIAELAQLSVNQRIALGAQDVFFEETGAYTGEVSLPMLKSVGTTYIIIGHSERRARREDDEEIYKDTTHVISHKTNAIVCVGELERDASGDHFTVVEQQLKTALRDVKKAQVSYLSIAYEPVWAIGTGDTATPEDAHEMKLFIQKILADLYGRATAAKIKILYGGSVKKGNAEALLTDGNVDGFLIGGASLRASEFANIVETARAYVQKK